PTLTTLIPAAKSMKRLPSTSSRIAPSAFEIKIGVTWNGPRATAACRSAINAWLFGPGTFVLRTIAIGSVPADGRLIEIDVHLLGLQIFIDAVKPQLTSNAALFVAAPGQ